MEDHDGTDTNVGGIERWLRPADAVGLDRDNVASKVGILPATLFAVDAYVRLVRDKSLHKAVAACLTKLFAAAIRAARIEGLLAN